VVQPSLVRAPLVALVPAPDLRRRAQVKLSFKRRHKIPLTPPPHHAEFHVETAAHPAEKGAWIATRAEPVSWRRPVHQLYIRINLL
jgi:hypothetical protein